MGTYRVDIPERLERMAQRRKGDLSAAIEEDLGLLYALLDMIGEDMAGLFTEREMALLREVFKNDEFEAARLREWPGLLAWDVEDVERYEKLGAQFQVNADEVVEKLETLTPVQALWLLHSIRQGVDTASASDSGDD